MDGAWVALSLRGVSSFFVQEMVVDTQDPFALNNLLRVNLQSREDVLVRLGRQPDVYEQLTASLAPSIWEMDDVKKGILCQLFGAATKVRPHHFLCAVVVQLHTQCGH